jgi:glycosyltransferase involved in cell wall biosynthesis
MRIVLITHFYPPGHIGGTEVLTSGLAKTLRAIGHEVFVVCAEDWDSAPSYQIQHTDELVDGVRVRRLRFNWAKAPDVFRSLYDNPEVARHLHTYLREVQPDVVHITSCYSLSASVIGAARDYGAPVVLTATDFWFLCARNTLLERNETLCSGPETPWKCARCHLHDSKIYRLSRRVLPDSAVATILQGVAHIPLTTRQPGLRGMLGDWGHRFRYLANAIGSVDRVIAASQFLIDLFARSGVDPSKLEFRAYGLDTSWAVGHTTKSASDRLRIGFIGQILPFKGPDLLIRAIRSLDAPVDLRIYGALEKSPEYGRSLRDLAGDDPRIAFCGTFENSRMGSILADLDVLAVPSTWYDFPLVISSALATKTPVIATDQPGMNELIEHDVNGLLFERSSWQGLAAQIQRLVDDRELYLRLQKNIQPVKDLEQMAAEYVTLYQSLQRSRVA